MNVIPNPKYKGICYICRKEFITGDVVGYTVDKTGYSLVIIHEECVE